MEITGGKSYSQDTAVDKPLVPVAIAKMMGVNIDEVGALCKHSGINMWAKFKPVRHSGADFPVGVTPISTKANDYDVMLARMEAANYGFSQKTLTSCSTFSRISVALESNWIYLSRTAPYHLADFYFYLHKAKSPDYYGEDKEVNLFWDIANGDGKVVFKNTNPDMSNDDSRYNITLYDLLSPLMGTDSNDNIDGYICLLLRGKNTSNSYIYKLFTSSAKIGVNGIESGISLDFSTDLADLFAGTDVVDYWVGCSENSHDGEDASSLTSDSYVSLPAADYNNNKGTLTYSNELGLELAVNAIGCAEEYSSVVFDTNIRKYTGIMPAVDDDSAYYYMVRSGTASSNYYQLWLQVSIKNTSSKTRTFNPKFAFCPSTNFTGSTLNSAGSVTRMWSVLEAKGQDRDNLGQDLSSVTIAPGATVNVAYHLPQSFLTALNSSASTSGSVSIGQKIVMGIWLKFGSYTMPNMLVSTLRLRN